MNSILKNKSFKEIDVFGLISFEEFHTDWDSLNSEDSLKMVQLLYSMFIQRFIKNENGK